MVFWERHKERPKPTLTLPYPILDQLKLDLPKTMLNKALVRSLIQDGESVAERVGFEGVVLYLMFKTTEAEIDTQYPLLQELVRTLAEEGPQDSWRKRVREFVRAYLEKLPDDWEIPIDKLKIISSQGGFELWDARYSEKAEELAKDTRDVFLIGNATFVGLPVFINAFKRQGKRLTILTPHAIKQIPKEVVHDGWNYPCGYTIEPNGEVHLLSANFVRPEHAVMVDDIENTGKTKEVLDEFWGRASTSVPDFETIAKVHNTKK